MRGKITAWTGALLAAAILLAASPVLSPPPYGVAEAVVAPTLLWGPYLTGTTANGTTINIRTDFAVAATVEYASEDYYLANNAYDMNATDGGSAELHHVALTGLEANTVYHYRVTYGAEATGDFRFSTFPDSGPFTFIVYSDSQDQLPLFSQSERHKLVADAIANESDIAFVLIAGDLVNNGSDLANWNRFFDAGHAMMAGTTIYPALGNHENDDALYFEAFGVPPYYSFDCGDAHFTVLDTNSDTISQIAWLNNDLLTDKTWRFASFHHPFYTSDPAHFGGWQNLRDDWEAMFVSNGVTAVFNGHIHTYERYLENGITYMVLGTGGGPLSSLGEDRYGGYQNSLEHSLAYARVTVDPAAGTTTAKIIRVADVSLDNSHVTTVYPPETVFEMFTLTPAPAIRPDWDLNGDGACNIGDVVVIGLHWGQTGTPGWIPQDINNDGVINIGDVVVIGLHWGESW
ncbi:MAG: metallophosphoesterase [Dehalococcoidia bacterium]|jgi:predicted phosphodiesterase